MNLNLLATSPGWEWYVIIAGPMSALVVAVWIFLQVPSGSLHQFTIATEYLLNTHRSRGGSRKHSDHGWNQDLVTGP